MRITGEYKDRVLEKFNNMKIGSVLELHPENEHYDLFVATVKIIIDWEDDLANGYVLEFNDEYTKVRKKGATNYD